MKYYLMFFLLSVTAIANAQKTKDNYNTRIDKAEKVETKDGVVTIMKADTVIVKIFIAEKKAYLYLDSLTQKYDTTRKLYFYDFYLANHQSPKTEIDLTFNFSSPVRKFYIGPNGSGGSNLQSMTSGDKTEFYTSGSIVCPYGIHVEVQSDVKVKTTIKGIDGYFKK